MYTKMGRHRLIDVYKRQALCNSPLWLSGEFWLYNIETAEGKTFFTKKYPGVFVTVQDIKIFCFLPFAYFFIGYVGHFPGTIGNGERILIEADDSAWSDQTVL